MMPDLNSFFPQDDGPIPPFKWEVEVNNTPQKLFVEAFGEECIKIRKQDISICVGMTSIEMEATLAILNWILKAGAVLGEIENVRDIVQDAAIGVEGK